MKTASCPLIRLENVSFVRNGKTVLHPLDWEIYSDQNWAVVGPNGAGKSVLMQVIQGKQFSSSGCIEYADGIQSRISQVSFEQHHRLIAREQDHDVFRQFSNKHDPGVMVRELLKNAQADSEGQIPLTDVIRFINVEHLLNSPIVTLSNGEMRKILIACALLEAPAFLVLDEPYDGLDTHSRQYITEMIDSLAERGIFILLVTHRVEELPGSITHILCLNDGKLVCAGEKEQLLNDRRISSAYLPIDRSEKIPSVTPVHFYGAADKLSLSAATPSIIMKNVIIRYGSKVILNRLNWVANRNENWAILGPNGAGKSTLLSLISGDHPQGYANEIYLFGRRRGSGESIWDIKRKMGILSPELQIRYRENLNAQDVVLSGFYDSIGLFRYPTTEQQLLARHWLAYLEIENLAELNYNLLSYGQKRLVLLARALVKSPEMLLLDEPCQGLDAGNRRRIVQAVSAISRSTGMQVIYVTHLSKEIPSCITHCFKFIQNPADPIRYDYSSDKYTMTPSLFSS